MAGLLGTLILGLAWSIVDFWVAFPSMTNELAHTGSPRSALILLWATAAKGALIASLWMFIPALLAFMVLDHPRFGRACYEKLVRDESSAATVVGTIVGLLLLSLLLFVLVIELNDRFNSPYVRALGLAVVGPALAWSVPVLSIRGVKLSGLLRTQSESYFMRSILLCGGALLFWLGGIFVLAYDVFDVLGVGWILACLSIFCGGLAGFWLVPRYRVVRRVGVVFTVVLVALATTGFVVEPTNSIRISVQVRGNTVMVHVPLRWIERAPVRNLEERMANVRIGSCDPEIMPADPREVGGIAADAPDIVLVTVDAFRWDRTTMGKYRRKTTPKLNKWAKKATVFERAYTPAASTRQSMRAIFTGLIPSLVESPKGPRWGLTFTPEQATLAEYLHAAGYKTIALISDKSAFPEQYGALDGFEVIDYSPVKIHKKSKYSADFKIDRILAHLRKGGQKGVPRFIWVHLRELHRPYVTGTVGRVYGKKPSDRYDAGMRFVDNQLDRLLQYVTGEEVSRPTVLMIASDHGEGFKEHGHRFHGSALYEEFIRVPWMVWGPGIKGQAIDVPVSLIDITPSLLGHLGLDVPKALCGRDQSRVFAGEAKVEPEPVYVEVLPDKARNYFVVAYIDGMSKYIRYPSSNAEELFDLASDPGEEKNLALSNEDKVQEFRERLAKMYLSHGLAPMDFGLKPVEVSKDMKIQNTTRR